MEQGAARPGVAEFKLRQVASIFVTSVPIYVVFTPKFKHIVGKFNKSWLMRYLVLFFISLEALLVPTPSDSDLLSSTFYLEVQFKQIRHSLLDQQCISKPGFSVLIGKILLLLRVLQPPHRHRHSFRYQACTQALRGVPCVVGPIILSCLLEMPARLRLFHFGHRRVSSSLVALKSDITED